MLVVNKLCVDERQELIAEFIQLVINPNVESDDGGSDLKENVDDAIKKN